MANNGRIDPYHHSERVAEYRDLLLPVASTYSGRQGTYPFPEWRASMEVHFRALSIPEEYRCSIAEQFLVGPAILYWYQVRGNYGLNPSMFDLANCLEYHFRLATAEFYWSELVKDFKQGMGEEITPFGFRFEETVLATCPHPLTEVHKMKIYQACIREEYRLPRPLVPYASYVDMRSAHDLIEDVDTLPYAPDPAPLHGEAPAVPVEPVPAADPAEGDDSEYESDSPREDTDPTEYDSEPDSEDLGEDDIVVDWDPEANPALEAQGDDAAPEDPFFALDPEDIEMDAAVEVPADGYVADLGTP